MSNYTIVTNFLSKDSLVSGNALKALKGAELTTEFTTVQTAINSKVDGSTQYFPDGNAAQPSVGFTNNAGTGMYNTGGVLSFATGATQRLVISAAGAVSVGGTYTGAASVAGGFVNLVQNNSSGTASYTELKASNDVSNVLAMAISSSGYTGQIIGNAAVGVGATLYTSGAVPLYIATNGNSRIAIGSAGNVSISAPSSGSPLTVTGNSTSPTLNSVNTLAGSAVNNFSNTSNSTSALIQIQLLNDAGNTFAMAENSSTATTGVITGAPVGVGATLYTGSAVPMYLATAGTSRIAITAAGNVTVNAPSSGTALAVNGLAGSFANTVTAPNTGNNSYGLRVQAGTSTTDSCFTAANAANTLNYLVVDGAGGVFLGAPTGAGQGIGTLNCTGLYVNSSPVYAGVPQNVQSGSTYTTVLADANKHIYHSFSGAKTSTIAANASVAYPIGTVITWVNAAAGALTIAINTDTLSSAAGLGNGSRTLAVSGMASALKITTTGWLISGTGLT